MAGLHNLIRFVIALTTIDRSNDRKLVQHRGLLGQVLANEFTGDGGSDRLKRTTIDQRTIGFHIPGVDMTRPACHPQQDDRPMG